MFKFIGNYAEIKNGDSQVRIWLHRASRTYTVEFGGTVTCSMIQDDFGNLVKMG